MSRVEMWGDRRSERRVGAAEAHGIVSARVRGGDSAVLVNVSATGALVETQCRLLPGTSVDLHLTTAEGRATVRGRIVRCAVSAIGGSHVYYRGAICFDAALPWPVLADAGDGYVVPGAGTPAQHAAGHMLLTRCGDAR